jgi:hypothetical protein
VNVKPLREGFVEAPTHEPVPPAVPPQAPLSPQKDFHQEPPEPELSEIDKLRAVIAASANPWPITVPLLYKPIQNDKGDEIKSLTFHEPTAADINRVGNPIRLNWENEPIIEERKMTAMMGALSRVQPVKLTALDPRDWNNCAWILKPFFLPDLRAFV